MLPLNTNIRDAYKHGRDDEQNFIQNLSLFLCAFLKEHSQLIEKKPELHDMLLEVSHPRSEILKNGLILWITHYINFFFFFPLKIEKIMRMIYFFA